MDRKEFKLRNIIVLMLSLFTIFAFTACEDKNTKNYTLPDVKEGETFEITLDGYGGTAYVWDYKISPNSGIEYVTMEHTPTNNNPDIMGGGKNRYTFKATKAGDYKIRFELKIPNESKSTIKTNVYKIRVIK